jgi:hypothetical protein
MSTKMKFSSFVKNMSFGIFWRCPPAHLSGTIKALREWAQKAVEAGNNRDIWELAYQLFTPDVSRVLRIQPKPWVPPGEGDFAFQTKAAAT